MTKVVAFVFSVSQDQTANNVQSDLWSTLSTNHSRLTVNCFFILQWKYILANKKLQFYLFGNKRVNSNQVL